MLNVNETFLSSDYDVVMLMFKQGCHMHPSAAMHHGRLNSLPPGHPGTCGLAHSSRLTSSRRFMHRTPSDTGVSAFFPFTAHPFLCHYIGVLYRRRGADETPEQISAADAFYARFVLGNMLYSINLLSGCPRYPLTAVC